jgi:ketosteroid isomerase-like protein
MSQHDLVNVIAAGDAAINAENFDAIMTFYAQDATLVIEPGHCVTGHAAIRNAFIAIAEYFAHTLRVSQEQFLGGRRHCSCARENARSRDPKKRGTL